MVGHIGGHVAGAFGGQIVLPEPLISVSGQVTTITATSVHAIEVEAYAAGGATSAGGTNNDPSPGGGPEVILPQTAFFFQRTDFLKITFGLAMLGPRGSRIFVNGIGP